jgi:hypothetical protein
MKKTAASTDAGAHEGRDIPIECAGKGRYDERREAGLFMGTFLCGVTVENAVLNPGVRGGKPGCP